MRTRPVRERPGKRAWLGPLSLLLGVVCWWVPLGWMVAVVAIACATASILTDRQYRLDWTAVTGASVAAGQLFFTVFLMAMEAAGH
ncbi:hypothetical protein [Amycolatopsis albispora]|uniref:Uncharacterized protein n=1 Tax=Amycolatopsis albispora TaxID=1804986 RepID=A0A344L2H6_9PSEU|nr:hypothetical protein [Amycolatopsis albispora]AXB42250.1 hypothetical protein A4R43_06655 [Amycolatopsis albispora]